MSTNYYVTHISYTYSNIPEGWIRKIHLSKHTARGHSFQAVLTTKTSGRYLHNPDFNSQNPSMVVDYWDDTYELSQTIETWEQWKAEILRDDLCIIDEYGTIIDKDAYINEVESMEDKSRPFTEFGGPKDNVRQYFDPQGYCFVAWPFF